MGKAAALILLAVFTLLAIQPEAAQLRLHLLLPAILVLDHSAGGAFNGSVVHPYRRLLVTEVAIDGRVETLELDDALKVVIVTVAVMRTNVRRLGDGR